MKLLMMPGQNQPSLSLLTLIAMAVFLLLMQTPEKHQADLEVEQEARLAAEQAAAGAVTHLILTFQKSSLCARMYRRLFIPQLGQHPDPILAQHLENLPKFQLHKESRRPAN